MFLNATAALLTMIGEEAVAVQSTNLAGAVAVLSAMITPAVLIAACGSLTISTGNRLARAVERTRELSQQFKSLAKDTSDADAPEQRAMLFDQLRRATRRARLLQRAMTRIYLAVSVFVATSVAIGIVAVTSQSYAWVPIILGLAGGALLFQASVFLIVESRIQMRAVRNEMKFTWEAGRQIAPSDLIEQHDAERRWMRRPWR
ncbi:MAG TPA: DUF2721 domain-containing protein [Longimicrobiales bacterium]|nr:DUF2721 domain-containing protein [Longimicrobiales bacterium]